MLPVSQIQHLVAGHDVGQVVLPEGAICGYLARTIRHFFTIAFIYFLPLLLQTLVQLLDYRKPIRLKSLDDLVGSGDGDYFGSAIGHS